MEGHSSQPLAWPGAWGPLPGYKSLLQGQSRQGYVHHVQYDSKPSLSWAAGAQRTVHTTHLGESSANECQQPPSFDGTHTTPPTPAPQDSRALPPPLPFQTHSCTPVPNVLMFSWKPAPVPYSSDPPEPDRVQFPLAWWSLSTIPCRRQGQDCEAGSTGGQRPEARTRKPEAPQQVTGLQQVPGPTCLHLQLRWIYLMRQSNPLLTSWFTHIITPKSYKILIYSCCNLDITAFLPRKLRSTLTLMGCVFIRSVTLPQRPGKKVKWYGHQGSFHLFKETRREEKVIYKSRGTQ